MIRLFWKRHSSILIAFLLALAFFFIQFIFINDYGVSWDEPLHRNWGKIFAIFLKTGDRHFLDLLPGHGIHYGPVYYFVNYLLSEKLFSLGLFSFVASNHILNLLTASVAVGFLFLLAQTVGGRRIGFLSVLFFVGFPQFLAHAHYNPKDIPLLTAVLLTSFVFVHALRQSQRSLFCLSGFLFGTCIALKVSALLMLPAFACGYFVWLWRTRKPTMDPVFLKREGISALLIFLSILVGTIVAWPSAWGDLSLIPRSILFFTHDFWPGKVLFFSQEYTGGALPWFYIPLEYVMATPLLTVLAFAYGCLVILRGISKKRDDPVLIFLLLWLFFPMLFSMKPGLVRYDGMRQFFFVLPAMTIIAATGFDALLGSLERSSRGSRSAVYATLAIVVLSLLHEIILLHPYEGSYRNELVRFAVPSDLDYVFQIEYWGPSYKQGLDWLRENAEPHPIICVPTAGILVTWYVWREDFTFECSPRSNYLMFFTRYAEAHEYALMAMPPVFTIERMGSTLLKIYKIK